MAYSDTLWNNYKQLSTVRYSADDFYDQSFVDRINRAQQNIDNLVAEKDQADSKRAQAQDAYDTFYGNMRNYSSMVDESEDKFGVTTSMENYEKAKYAVAATEQQLQALPSTINATSGVVLNQRQRESAYNVAANKWEQTMNTRQQAVDVNKETWENARRNADIYAQELYGEQLKTQESLALKWSTQTSAFQKARENILSAENVKWQIESDYRSWQWNQAKLQNAYARARAEDAFNAYMNQYKREQADIMEQYQRQAAEREMERQQREREYKERLAKSLVNYHHAQQQAKQTANVVNAGGLLGRLAYLASR